MGKKSLCVSRLSCSGSHSCRRRHKHKTTAHFTPKLKVLLFPATLSPNTEPPRRTCLPHVHLDLCCQYRVEPRWWWTQVVLQLGGAGGEEPSSEFSKAPAELYPAPCRSSPPPLEGVVHLTGWTAVTLFSHKLLQPTNQRASATHTHKHNFPLAARQTGSTTKWTISKI